MLTFLKTYFMMESEHQFAYERGFQIMNENKIELLKLLLENDNLENAIMTANAIILDCLKQHESSEERASACLQVCGQMNPSY